MWKRRFLNVEKSVKECIWILISKLQRRTYVATQSSTFQDFEEINKIGFFLKGKRFLCTFASRGFSRSKKKLIFLLLIFFVTLFRWKRVRNITRSLIHGQCRFFVMMNLSDVVVQWSIVVPYNCSQLTVQRNSSTESREIVQCTFDLLGMVWSDLL